jgi:hypothetical protein
MNLKDRVSFNLTDLTGIGVPQSAIGSKFLSNEQLYELDPVRFQFYMQVLESLSSSNPKVLEDIFSKANLTRYQREQLNSTFDNIRAYFERNKGKLNGEKLVELKNEIAAKLNENILTEGKIKDINVLDRNGVIQKGGAYQKTQQDDDARGAFIKGIAPAGDVTKSPYDTLKEFESYTETNPYTHSQKLNASVIPKDKESEVLQSYKNSYEFGPDAEKVNMADRVIFIVATYILRSIALFMVEWGVHTNFINTFVKAFSLYFGVYACVFLLLYILTNAREDDYLFRMLFFYINTQSEDGKGILRIFIHLICVMFLFPIPFVVREYREMEADNLSFTQKRTVIGAVEKFTMIVWILTSVIALRI